MTGGAMTAHSDPSAALPAGEARNRSVSAANARGSTSYPKQSNPSSAQAARIPPPPAIGSRTRAARPGATSPARAPRTGTISEAGCPHLWKRLSSPDPRIRSGSTGLRGGRPAGGLATYWDQLRSERIAVPRRPRVRAVRAGGRNPYLDGVARSLAAPSRAACGATRSANLLGLVLYRRVAARPCYGTPD